MCTWSVRSADMPRGDRARHIPEATVARLPVYLRTLGDMLRHNTWTVSSERLAELSGVNAAKVRKDLSYLGSYGTRGVGYDVEYLLSQVRRELGLTQQWPVVIVGVGNLGRALADYAGFTQRGFPIVALVDHDPAKIGTEHVGLQVHGVDDLRSLVAAHQVEIGVVATPPDNAQEVTDRLVDAGISSILNFASTVLVVPEDVRVRQVDLALELQILSFYRHQDAAPR